MGLREWVILLALVFIVVLSADAVRRVRRQRRFHGRYTTPQQEKPGAAAAQVAPHRVRLDAEVRTPPSTHETGAESDIPMLVESVDAEPQTSGDGPESQHAQAPDTGQYEFDLPPATQDEQAFLSEQNPAPMTPPGGSRVEAPGATAGQQDQTGPDTEPAPASAALAEADSDTAGAAMDAAAGDTEYHFDQAADAEAEDGSLGSREAPPLEADDTGEQLLADPDEVLVITVLTDREAPYEGPALLQIMLACGMRFGSRNIFHATDDNGLLQYSAANAVNPGTFDLEHIDQFDTRGVTFFLQLPCQADPLQAFDTMYRSATTLSTYLGGDILDETRSVMTAQTLTHYRERIRDYQRTQLVPRNRT